VLKKRTTSVLLHAKGTIAVWVRMAQQLGCATHGACRQVDILSCLCD